MPHKYSMGVYRVPFDLLCHKSIQQVSRLGQFELIPFALNNQATRDTSLEYPQDLF